MVDQIQKRILLAGDGTTTPSAPLDASRYFFGRGHPSCPGGAIAFAIGLLHGDIQNELAGRGLEARAEFFGLITRDSLFKAIPGGRPSSERFLVERLKVCAGGSWKRDSDSDRKSTRLNSSHRL